MDKDNILLASSEEFMRLGIRSVSMDDISTKLGISKKTLYQIVDNKEELVAQAMAAHLHLEKKLLEDIRLNANDALDEMIQIGRHMLIIFRSITPMVIHDLKKYYPKVWRMIREFSDGQMAVRIIRNLKSGIEEGFYRKSIQPEFISRMYVLAGWNIVDETNFSLRDYRIDDLVKQHLNYHISGILSEKGRIHIKNYEIF